MKKKHQLLVTNMELPAVFRVQNRKETTPYIPEAHAIGGQQYSTIQSSQDETVLGTNPKKSCLIIMIA